jgi:hypothetical protein
MAAPEGTEQEEERHKYASGGLAFKTAQERKTICFFK